MLSLRSCHRCFTSSPESQFRWFAFPSQLSYFYVFGSIQKLPSLWSFQIILFLLSGKYKSLQQLTLFLFGIVILFLFHRRNQNSARTALPSELSFCFIGRNRILQLNRHLFRVLNFSISSSEPKLCRKLFEATFIFASCIQFSHAFRFVNFFLWRHPNSADLRSIRSFPIILNLRQNPN